MSFPYFSTNGLISVALQWCRFSCTYILQVYCDHQDTKSYTIVQQRLYGNENFYRGYHDYEIGFGQLSGDYWAGLITMYHLTSLGKCYWFLWWVESKYIWDVELHVLIIINCVIWISEFFIPWRGCDAGIVKCLLEWKFLPSQSLCSC